MLNSPTDTTAAMRIGSRQPQTREVQRAQSGFAAFVADNAAAKTDAPRPRAARETDDDMRPAAPRKANERRTPDDRAAPDAERTSSASYDEIPARDPSTDGKQTATAKKTAKSDDDASDTLATASTGTSADTVAAADSASVMPTTVPVIQPDPTAAPVPIAAPSIPAAVVAPPALLSIAAAGIAAGKTSGGIAAAKTSDPAATDGPDSTGDSRMITPDVAIAPAAQSTAASSAKPPRAVVETGFGKTADVEIQVADATDTAMPKGDVSTPDTKPLVAAAAAQPKVASTEAKPDTIAGPADGVRAPPSPEEPHQHRAAAPAASPTFDAAPSGPLSVAPQPLTLHAAATVSPAAQLAATIATAAPVSLNGLAVELAARAQSGHSRFDIRLDPAELGRIDVRIDIDRNGQVTSHLTVEKPETLAMLRQDSPQLQRALNDAGLKTADGALQFTLGDHSQSRQQTESGERQTQRFIIRDDEAVASTTPVRGYGRMIAARSCVDISV